MMCPACHQPGLVREPDRWACAACGRRYPIVNGVARFVGTEFYTGSFGYQWTRFSRTQLDSANGSSRSRDAFVEKTGWRLEDLAGARVLDAGCGMGRFAEVAASAGADVHGVDLSVAVDAAQANLGHRPNVHLYQADIMNLPFPEESFDAIYSLGVLHHTPDTKAAFLRLVRLLRPGGRIAIWVYAKRRLPLDGGEVLRLLTPRLPKPMLLNACRVAVPLYHLYKVPVLGRIGSALFPVSQDPDPGWRQLDTFDWYSPAYQWKHTYEEVTGWFTEAGLSAVRRQPFPVSVSGRRPEEGAA